jgi:deoxyribodipyrimidine photo-lyase
MIESLIDLNHQIHQYCKTRLIFLYGNIQAVIDDILAKNDISSISITADYTPFAKHRQDIIKRSCKHHKCSFHLIGDYLLTDNKVTKDNGRIYVKFTPFYRAAVKYHKKHHISVNTSITPSKIHNICAHGQLKSKYIIPESTNLIDRFISSKLSQHTDLHGGRQYALDRLTRIQKNNLISRYGKTRDLPHIETTHLAPYIKFGLVSIREVYQRFHSSKVLTKQLYWRDFYTLITDAYPHVISGKNMKTNMTVHWPVASHEYTKKWHAWCNGKTGYPLVDAGMRQLNETGWMHNRVRMVVADFLIKVLHIEWRKGELYFASKLIDYDVAVNNGSWQWQAGTGTDSQPYFRIFNPWSQSKRFDKDCLYIKKWVPELSAVDNKDIHKWYFVKVRERYPKIHYIDPVVDYFKESKKYPKMVHLTHKK